MLKQWLTRLSELYIVGFTPRLFAVRTRKSLIYVTVGKTPIKLRNKCKYSADLSSTKYLL